MIRIVRSVCDFQFACELGAMSEMKFVLTRKKLQASNSMPVNVDQNKSEPR